MNPDFRGALRCDNFASSIAVFPEVFASIVTSLLPQEASRREVKSEPLLARMLGDMRFD
jgi:hypothetical protein